MPLMTNLYTGVSGLTSSQNAINISAHNLSNIYTEGYVRQQAQFSDRTYTHFSRSSINPMQIGYGSESARTQHYRDILLDKAYREQSGREEFYGAQYDAIVETETILGELNGEAFQAALADMWSSLSEVAKTPDSTVARESLIMNSETFISRAKEVYADLVNYQDRLDTKVESIVDRINQIGEEIHTLNLLIQSVEAPDVEQAMDFRDTRDSLLDELGSLVSIKYEEDPDGYVTIRVEGEEFVTKGGYFKMGVAELNAADNSTYKTPVWPQNDNKEVFELGVEISASRGNDVGELKGLLLARGDYNATYKDIPHVEDPPQQEDFMVDGVLDETAFNDAVDEYWNVTYPEYEAEVRYYHANVGHSPIMKVQAMFDQLINGIVTTINDLLCPNTQMTYEAGSTMTLSAGTVYNQLSDEMKAALAAAGITKEADFAEDGTLAEDLEFTLARDLTIDVLNLGYNEEEDVASYGADENNTPGTELFSRANTIGRYTTMSDADGNMIYVYNPYNEFGNPGEYTVSNLVVNQVVLDESAYLPFTTEDFKVDMQLGQDLLNAWDAEYTNLNPDNMTKKDFNDYYSGMAAIIANDGYVYKEIAANQNTVVATLDDSRTSFTGVSSNDELTNLIKFKNAYNANSRYINVVTEMLDTLINKVGNW